MGMDDSEQKKKRSSQQILWKIRKIIAKGTWWFSSAQIIVFYAILWRNSRFFRDHLIKLAKFMFFFNENRISDFFRCFDEIIDFFFCEWLSDETDFFHRPFVKICGVFLILIFGLMTDFFKISEPYALVFRKRITPRFTSFKKCFWNKYLDRNKYTCIARKKIETNQFPLGGEKKNVLKRIS